AAASLVGEPAKYHKQLTVLQRRISAHLENQSPTPYRDAIAQIKRQVDAACKGEGVTVGHHGPARPSGSSEGAGGNKPAPAPLPLPAAVAVGEAAPDFVATEFTTKGTARLDRWKGRPILLVFYHPSSITIRDLLRFAQEVHTGYSRHVSVIGLSVSDDNQAVLTQLKELKLGFPVLYGGGIRISYGVETTPKLVLIDSAGIVRGMYMGWGAETAREVLTDLRRWLPVK